jgi:hypothetical protein
MEQPNARPSTRNVALDFLIGCHSADWFLVDCHGIFLLKMKIIKIVSDLLSFNAASINHF